MVRKCHEKSVDVGKINGVQFIDVNAMLSKLSSSRNEQKFRLVIKVEVTSIVKLRNMSSVKISRCRSYTEHWERVALIRLECRNVVKRGIEEQIFNAQRR